MYDVKIIVGIICLAVILMYAINTIFVQAFKIVYYEQKLKNRDVDIDKVKNIKTVAGIIKL